MICALLFVLWGAASAGSLVVQIQELNEYGWPDENSDGEVVAWTTLYLSAAASGCWVAIWGLFGLAWRPPLHFGFLALLVAVALEVAGNLVQADYIADLSGRAWGFGDQMQWYGDRVTFQSNDLYLDQETAGFFIALPLVTAVLPVVAYLVALLSGAGRKRRIAPAYSQQAYPPQAYPQQQQAYQPPPQQQAYQPPPPAYQPPPQPPPQPPQPRVPWQQVPPVVPPARPAPPPRADPPDQETLPYQKPPPGR